MRTIRHNGYIARRKRRARLLAVLGFLVLTSTLWIALNPNLLLPAYIAMFVGFITFNIGMQQIGKWSRNPRNDQLLDHVLNKLPDRFTMAHYPPIGSRKAEHVLLYPGGIIVLSAKEIDGYVEAQGGKWRRKKQGLRRIFSFSGPQLGNPGYELSVATNEVERFLQDQQLEVDVNGTVVFLHPNVQLDVEDPEYPVLHGDELREFLLALPTDESFTSQERDQLSGVLAEGEDVEQPATSSSRKRPVKRRAA